MQPRDPLRGQFVHLQSRYLLEGRWARMWQRDRGLGASLLPVLALLTRGYKDHHSDWRMDRLAQLGGIDQRSLFRGLETLWEEDMVLKFEILPRLHTGSCTLDPEVFTTETPRVR